MIGLQLALPAEAASLLADIEQPRRESRWGQSLTWGRLAGQDVVLTLSGVGKVAAATTSAMLAQLDVSLILVAGTSGGLAVGVEPGDVLIATESLQHDLDVRPFNPRWEQPELGISRFPSAPSAVRALRTAADTVLARGNPVAALDLPAPHVREGLIVSGDVFVRSHEAVRQLRQDLPEALAVDMESAAAAQVCTSARLPLGIVRVISDRANSQAPVDFPAFLKLAAPLLRDLVVETLAHLD